MYLQVINNLIWNYFFFEIEYLQNVLPIIFLKKIDIDFMILLLFCFQMKYLYMWVTEIIPPVSLVELLHISWCVLFVFLNHPYHDRGFVNHFKFLDLFQCLAHLSFPGLVGQDNYGYGVAL